MKGMVVCYPHGHPEQAAVARVKLASENGRSLALIYEDKPPFATVKGGGIAFLPGEGIIMLLMRVLDSGLYIEMFGQGQYEVELAAQCSSCALPMRKCCDREWLHIGADTPMCAGAHAIPPEE